MSQFSAPIFPCLTFDASTCFFVLVEFTVCLFPNFVFNHVFMFINHRRDDLWDPRGKPPSGRPKSAAVKSSLPPRFQRNRDSEDMRGDRDSMGRDMLGELRDTFPPPKDMRDVPMSSSWGGQVDRRRMDSSDSVHSKV